jgi:hypothetical protein
MSRTTLNQTDEDGRLVYANDDQPIHGTGAGYTDAEFKVLGLKRGKPVKSTDFYRELAVKALKDKSKCTRVTDVRDHGDRTYSGNCLVMAKGRNALRLGRFVVRL